MMKWTMLSVALMGLATYGVIYLAQLQHEPTAAPEARPAAGPFEVPETEGPSPATLPAAEVSESAAEVEANAAVFAGDPWTVGVEAFEAHRDELAVSALRAAVAEREESGYRHYVLALALRRTGEVEDAIAELERSLELGPGAAKTWIALARCELDRGETTAARAAVDAALELDLDSADAWHLLGRVELDEGALEHAEAAFAKALDRDPEHAWAANNLGYVRILQERFAEALGPLQVAVAGGKAEPVFLNNLGTALERTGRSELAALAFAHAAVLGHEPAGASLERVESDLAAAGHSFAAADSVEIVDAPQLAARVEQAVLLGRAEVVGEDEELIESDLVAANENGDSRR